MKKASDSVESGVPYENASAATLILQFAVISTEFYLKIEPILLELERRSQKHLAAQTRTDRKGAGAKWVRKRRAKSG